MKWGLCRMHWGINNSELYSEYNNEKSAVNSSLFFHHTFSFARMDMKKTKRKKYF